MHSMKQFDQIRTYLWYLLLFVVVLFPLAWVFFGSFKPITELFSYPPKFFPEQWTMQNYRDVFQRTPMMLYMKNTFIVAIATVLGSLSLAAPAAYGFSRYDFRLKYPLLIAMLGLQLIPSTVNIVPYYLMMSKLNLLNTLSGLSLIFISGRIPFSIWILKGFFDSLPRSLAEAARIDGCGPLRAFWSIMLPLSLPGLGAAGFLSFLSAWGEMLIPLVVTSAKNVSVISVGLFKFFGDDITAYSQLFAATVTSVLPIVVMFLLSQETFVSGLTSGSGK